MLGVQRVNGEPELVIAHPATGPMTQADRDFVVKVRSAGLWEYPVGRLALKKGTTKAVRTAGEHLIDGDAALDAAGRNAAGQLGITLPNQPSQQQQGFVSRLNGDSGKQFDTDMATILRATNGQMLATIASVRTTTRNSLVRALANLANDTVLDHITVVEKTGVVDFDQALSLETTAPQTPPPPVAGQPQVVLTPPAHSTVSPSPSVG
jgi:predicted outer membrane protein